MKKQAGRFKVGRRYRRMDGVMVTVLEAKNKLRGYETVRCSDDKTPDRSGGHRYNRTTHTADTGRCTGTKHDFSDPRNLDPRQIGLKLSR